MKPPSFPQPFRQVLMKALRSSPFKLFAEASLLQEVIFCCWVCLAAGAAVSPFRQLLMKVLRSSPFLPVASLLHVAMRCCCGVSSFLAAACGAAIALAEKASREATARTRSCIHMANPYVAPGESGASELTSLSHPLQNRRCELPQRARVRRAPDRR